MLSLHLGLYYCFFKDLHKRHFISSLLAMEQHTTLQNKGDHLLQSIRDLYHSKEDSDVTLLCDDQVTVLAHKFLLGIHSSVLKSVLLDTNESPCCISLPGTRFEDLDLLLNLVYFRKSLYPDCGNNKDLFKLMKTFDIEIPSEAILKQELVEHESIEELTTVKIDSETEQSETDQSANCSMPMEEILENFVVQDKKPKNTKEYKKIVPNYFCNPCKMTFSSDSALEEHYDSKKHQKRKVKCNVCKSSFINEMMLKIHMEEHQEETIVDKNGRLCCNKCDKTFKTIYKLRDHKVIHVQGLFSCDHCTSKFSSYHALKSHLKHYDDRVACDQCDKKYRGKFLLNEHKLSVHQGLRLKCNFCDRGFSGSSNLAKHVQADHIGRRFNCDQCEYSAKNRSFLRVHTEAEHPTETSKLYECGDCSYRGYSEFRFKKHIYNCTKRNRKMSPVQI